MLVLCSADPEADLGDPPGAVPETHPRRPSAVTRPPANCRRTAGRRRRRPSAGAPPQPGRPPRGRGRAARRPPAARGGRASQLVPVPRLRCAAGIRALELERQRQSACRCTPGGHKSAEPVGGGANNDGRSRPHGARICPDLGGRIAARSGAQREAPVAPIPSWTCVCRREPHQPPSIASL